MKLLTKSWSRSRWSGLAKANLLRANFLSSKRFVYIGPQGEKRDTRERLVKNRSSSEKKMIGNLNRGAPLRSHQSQFFHVTLVNVAIIAIYCRPTLGSNIRLKIEKANNAVNLFIVDTHAQPLDGRFFCIIVRQR